MRAVINADPARGAGCGIIEIHDAAVAFGSGSSSHASGESSGPVPAFVISRASDGKHLSASGWQVSESPLRPDAWDSDGGKLRMAVGPTVVDEIDSLDAYRLTLPSVGVCALALGQLRYSNIEGGRGVGIYSPPAPVPAPTPEPSPEPLEPESNEAPLDMQAPQSLQAAPESKGKTGLIIVALVLLLAAGVACWWFFLRAPEQGEQSTKPLPAQSAAPAAASPAANKTSLSALAAAREQLRGEALPEVSLALAKPLRKAEATPEECDAAFLLFEDAAQKGNAEAMFFVGQFYDPGFVLPRGSIPADAAQAKRWYDAAAQKEIKEALSALQALRAYLQGAATKGDKDAEALLQTWK